MAESKSNDKQERERHGGPVGHGGPVQMAVEKPKHFKKSLGKLIGILKPSTGGIVVMVLLTILATVFSIVSPKILGNMTNQIVDDFISVKVYDAVQDSLVGVELPKGTTLKKLPETLTAMAVQGKLSPEQLKVMSDMQKQGGESEFSKVPEAQRELIENLDLSQKPQFHYEVLAQIALLLTVLYLISALANYISGWVGTNITQRIVYKLRRDLSAKINRMPIRYFDRHQYGDVLSRVTNDVDTVAQSLNQVFGQAISAVVMLVGILIMMFTISWQLTIIALLVLPTSFGLVGLIAKKSQKHFKNQQNRLGTLNGHIEENYAGQTIVKAFSGEDKAEQHFNDVNGKLYESSWKSQFISGLMMPLMNFISNLGYVATAVAGGWLALNGRLSIGDIQAFIQYMSQFNQPIVQAGQIANLLQSTVAAAERVFEFLEEAEETPDPAHAQKLSSVKGEVVFNGVHFGYEKGQPIIKNFSAHIKPGQKVAIVGPTGAGKTTMVNLLMRFYDADSGTISIDGVNTRDMKRADVRALFGMVLQDTWLFKGTIRENLVYGDLHAERKQVKTAAKAAHVDHFVQALPKSYDTKIEEDSENISVGEKQLLTIARAMLADAPMMILDEATSSVDTRTEVLIQGAMEKLTKGRTSFVIAHRLSTIKNADLILVMRDGNIVEQGNHEALLKSGGFYAELYQAQFAK
ncbi:MAG: ABC transporter ATP-binding protein/permease [Candidatus Nomurabacteria bacterium]|jgi:ATP-binding cassette subfamily B protein|nr:ABC transporter ATP-binding protein/permease [Candidatus Nomurabacteria bacterium]